MADLNELRVAVGTIEGAEDAVDAVAGIPEDAAHAPLLEPIQYEVADRSSGLLSSSFPAVR